MEKIIVVGAGIGGLITAALLANRGIPVDVYERAPIPGGRSHVLSKNGFNMSYGAHALLTPAAEPMKAIYKELGIQLKWNKLNNSKFKLLSNQRVVPGMFGPGALTTPAIDGFVNRLRFFKTFIKLLRLKPTFPSTYSVEQWLQEQKLNPSVEKALRAYFSLSVYDRSMKDFAMNALIEHMKHVYTKSVPLVYISYDQLFQQLIQIIESNQGRILYGQEVTDLIVQDSKAIGVKLKAGEAYADQIIMNLTPTQLLKVCSQHGELKDEVGAVAQHKGNYAYIYDIMLSKRFGHDIQNLLDLDSGVYINVFSLNEPTSAPNDTTLLNCLRFLSREEQQDDSLASASSIEIERVLGHAFPGWSEHVIGVRKVNRALVNGVARYINHTLLPFESKTVKGLHFVGDSTRGKGSLSIPAYDSAWQVANQLSPRT